MLEIKGFSKIYKGAQVYSAKNISLTVNNGEVCGLVGSNGAGKSTLIRSIVGIQPFQEGSIQIDGADIVKQPQKAKSRIGYVPDDHTVYDKLTGREYVDYMGSIYGATRAMKEDVLKNLAEYFSIGYALDMQIANYSHGMKQKICILGSLVHRPALWVLDEVLNKKFDARLAALLVEEAGYAGGADVRLTHEQLAAHLGTVREAVSRMLKYFEQEGLVSLFRGGVHIADMAALRALAGK